MQSEGIRLVVPVGLHKAFPEIRGELMSLSAFIDELKNSIGDIPTSGESRMRNGMIPA